MDNTYTRIPMLALLCSALLIGSSANAQAVTIVVKAGDTVYSLAKAAGLTPDVFMSINSLTSTDIKIGQVLTSAARESIQYTVQAGDTVYSIARNNKVSTDALMSTNSLTSDTISVGQVLKIPTATATASGPSPTVAQETAPPPAAPISTTPALLTGNWLDNAMSLVGVSYAYGASSRQATDCSGLILQVFSPLGIKLPRTSLEQAKVGTPVDINSLQAGDLLFFDTAGAGKVNHVGIYLGNDSFINANSYKGQVAIDRFLSDKYWAPKYLAARRILPVTTGLPTMPVGMAGK